MKKLFTFLTVKEAHSFLRNVAKIVKAIYIVIATLGALIGLIGSISFMSDEGVFGFFYFIMAVVGSLLILLIGTVIEALLIGFSTIVRNNFEELKSKNILDPNGEETFKEPNPNMDKLNTIKELRDNGFLSDAEYEELRKEIISKL